MVKTLALMFVAVQTTFAVTADASPPQCSGIVRPNASPDTSTDNMWAGAIRADIAGDMGGIWGDVINSGLTPPVQTSNMFMADYSWVMLATNNSTSCCWVQIGTGWISGGEVIYYQLQNANEPQYDYWVSVDSNMYRGTHYTLTDDPCNACTYDQYNQPATGWAYAWYRQDVDSGTGTLLLQKPIDFHPTTTQYAAETKNYGDQIGGTMNSPVHIERLSYFYPAGSGQWYWMDNQDPNRQTAWGPANTSPFAISEPPRAYYNTIGATTDLVIYDKRCAT